MKIDMDIHKWMGRPLVEVRLNGMTVRNCISADEEKGEVLYYDNPPQTEYTPEGIKLIIHHSIGKVQIILGDSVRKQ